MPINQRNCPVCDKPIGKRHMCTRRPAYQAKRPANFAELVRQAQIAATIQQDQLDLGMPS